jgi:NitT/TauT family transport system permease protein
MEKILPRGRDAWLPVLGAASIIALWHFTVVLSGVAEYIAPTPGRVLEVFFSQFPLILENYWPTLLECLLGFVLGSSAAIGVAVLFVHFRSVRTAYFPIAVFANTIPILALAPILTLIFGIGFLPKMLVSAIVSFFPVLVNMLRGLESPSVSERELMHVLSASQWELFTTVRLPRSLPYLFSALRIVSTTSVIGAIVGEWIGSDQGLGALIIQSAFNYRAPLLYAAIFASSSLALLQFGAVVLIEKRVIRWQA